MIEYPKRILLATDGGESSERASELAVALSAGSGAELHVIHVRREARPSTVSGSATAGATAPPLPGEPPGYAEREGRRLLDRQVQQIRDAGGEIAEAHLRTGQPAREVLAACEELGADMIVVGDGRPRAMRRAGAATTRRAALGQAADVMVREARCPVLVAHGERVREEEKG